MPKRKRQTKKKGASNAANERKRSKPTEEETELRTRSSQPTFFGIPGELRNRIYRYAIVEDGDIMISQSTAGSPGITRVNRQAYRESMSIFLLENSFRTQSIDLASPLPCLAYHWSFAIRDLGCNYQGVYILDNLVAWIKTVFRSGGLEPDTSVDGGAKGVVDRGFDIMREIYESRGTWPQVERALKAYKLGMEALDEGFWNGSRQI